MNSGKGSLTGKTAIVTGAASARGIGRAIAVTLAKAGAEVVVTDINVSGADYDLESTAAEVRNLGRRSLAVKADISSEEDVDNMVRETVREFGTVDIMVNNAGLSAALTYRQVTRDHWEALLNTNVIGTHNCCLAASRVMIEKKQGCIINITSTTGIGPSTIFYAYGALKAALNHMTTTLALELSSYNIRVNAVAPGAIETDISEHDIGLCVPTSQRFQSLGMVPPEAGKKDAASAKTWNIAQPVDVASTVLFLAADEMDFMTGRIIPVHR